MFGKKSRPAIKSLIGQGSHIEGHLTFEDGLRIDGTVTGPIRAASDRPSLLVISESASVHGDIEADHVVINGRVNGRVQARRLLELQPKAHIEGDVHYAALEMHQGAVISGQLQPDAVAKPLLTLAANNG